MTRIIIEGVAPDKMRLEAYREVGCGDWFVDKDGDIRIQVACEGDTDPWDHLPSFLCALHELYEARKCFQDGVTQGAVDAFDVAFQGDGQPGDDVAAPYRRQHRAAMIVEHMAAILFGIMDHGEVR